MDRRLLSVACLLGMVLFVVPRVNAQTLDVAIVAAAWGDSTNCRFTDPQTRLLATGMFASVDIINTNTATPDLATLMQYDACLCWTNFVPANNVAWGNVMADYVDAGGGVVVAVFSISDMAPEQALGGRWQTGGYEVIIPFGGTTTGRATLGNINDPGHPVMQGVSSFSGGMNSYRPTTNQISPGSTVVAEWSDGKILVAAGPTPLRVDLGFYPPSNTCAANFLDPTTDAILLMANALQYVALDTDTFIRGECNDDSFINLSDIVFLLNYLFPPTAPPAPLACEDSCDVNDDGSLNLVDAIGLLNFLFGIPPIPFAGPNTCGTDPTQSDNLSCVGLAVCP